MNTLKALAKMTKLAAHLTEVARVREGERDTLQDKYDDTVRIATERHEAIKRLEAKLFASEQKVLDSPSMKYVDAVARLTELGYAFEHSSGWTLPAPVADPIPDVPDREYLVKHGYAPMPVGAPAAAAPPLHWPAYPWATHFLNSKLGGVFAELVNGEYLGDPTSDVGFGRLKYWVGLGENDFKVSAVRPGYDGPLTRGADV